MATIEVSVTNPGGALFGPFALSPEATIQDLKKAIAGASDHSLPSQRLVFGDRPLAEDDLQLKSLLSDSDSSSALAVSLFTLKRRSLALSSQGACLVGEWGVGQNAARKPLLRYDDAYPAENWNDRAEGVPSEFDSAEKFQNHLKTADPNWTGDCQHSTFLPDSGEVIISIPGLGSNFTRIGFTYSPWDRNYGPRCDVALSMCGEAWVDVGYIETPLHDWDRNYDPADYSPKTSFLELGPHAAASYSFVRLTWGNGGSGRRLFFVYAFGY